MRRMTLVQTAAAIGTIAASDTLYASRAVNALGTGEMRCAAAESMPIARDSDRSYDPMPVVHPDTSRLERMPVAKPCARDAVMQFGRLPLP